MAAPPAFTARRARPAAAGLAALLAALALAACGDSKEEKAQQSVCDARADISKEVDKLKGLTPATVSVDAVTSGLSAIREDLSKIGSAQGDLSDDRRQQVQSATKALSSQVQAIVRQVATSGGSGDAKSQLTAALQQFATASEQAFKPVDCS